MKLLSLFSKNLVQTFLALGFVFGFPSVQAEDLKEQVKLLNKSKSAKNMGSALKKIFNKSEDQRKINKDVKTALKMSKKHKWVWKYELKGKEIAFKVNGKTQFTFKPVHANHGEFLFNGQKFVLNPGLSYEDHKKRMSKILSKKQASLEQFFINKAHAFASRPNTPKTSPVLKHMATSGLATASIVVNNEDKARARQCVRNKLDLEHADDGDPNKKVKERYRNKLLRGQEEKGLKSYLNGDHFQSGQGGQGYQAVAYRWGTWWQRIDAIVGNYSDNKWSNGYIQYDDREKYGYSYLPGCSKNVGLFEVSCRGACRDKNSCIGKCTAAKMNNAKGWWGMTAVAARGHCEFAWDVYQNCLYCNHPWKDHTQGCFKKTEETAPKPYCECDTKSRNWIGLPNCVIPPKGKSPTLCHDVETAILCTCNLEKEKWNVVGNCAIPTHKTCKREICTTCDPKSGIWKGSEHCKIPKDETGKEIPCVKVGRDEGSKDRGRGNPATGPEDTSRQ